MEPNPSDFGTPHRSTYSRPPQGSSGWCGTCGLRRGADGRCSNCDAWWTSPLVQYGAPLLIAFTFLLILGVSLLRPKSSFLTVDSSPIAVPAARSFGIASPSPGFPGGFASAPLSGGLGYTLPARSAPAALQTASLSQNQALWEQTQELNNLTLSVEAAYRADQTAQRAAERAASGQALGRRRPGAMASSAVTAPMKAF